MAKSPNNPWLDSCVCCSWHNLLFRHPFILVSVSDGHFYQAHSTPLLRETRGACKPNLQVAITRARRVCSQDSFVFVFHRRMNVIHRTQFDHAPLRTAVTCVWSRTFWSSITFNLRKTQRLSLERLNLQSIPHELPNVWLLLALVINSKGV